MRNAKSMAAIVPVKREQDLADRHLKVLIESMSRAGCSEREIVAAVERASGRVSERPPGPIAHIFRLARSALGGQP